MTVNLTVKADVVDITTDTPRAKDSFLVDTNVWYWITYTRASQSVRPPVQYQTSDYPAYANAALGAGAKVFQSGLSLAELSYLIEKAEFEIFAKSNPTIFLNPKKFDKRFRHDYTIERTQTVLEIQTAWAQVNSLSKPLAITVNLTTTNAALNRLKTEKVNGYDLFLLETMKNNSIIQLITDDCDFATVPGIQVFTANRKVIQKARTQGRLLSR